MSSLIPSVLAAVAALLAAFLSYRSSTQANGINQHTATTADYDAQFVRLQRIIDEQDRYTDRLRAEVARLSNQIESVRKQVETEQEVSNSLRSQIRALHGQLSALEQLSLYDRTPERGGNTPS